MKKEALVILSGGQDSTTCLFLAKERYKVVSCVTFDYNQRHKVEIDAAFKVAALARVFRHDLISVQNVLKSVSPLTSSNEVGQYKSTKELPGGIEPTFVPMRNSLFLTVAANRAVLWNIQDIYIGVSAVDYGGYPDCRPGFISTIEKTINQSLKGVSNITIHTPLINRNKEETVNLAVTLPGCMDALAYTHTCYNGLFPPCGKCHACLLRAKGFKEAGVKDPLITRAKKEETKTNV